MRQIKKYIIPCVTAGMLLLSGCKKYLDVNQNLNQPTFAPISILLTSAEQRIGSMFAIGSTVGNATGVYTHQLMQYGEWNRYGQGGGTFAGTWSTGFSIMTNLDVIIDEALKTERPLYAGVAKVLKAYLASMMVDLWGDMPYSEYGKFKEGNRQPKFDDDATIYPKLITLLNEALVHFQSTATQARPGQDDLVYKGNITKWIKAANTIKLKLYTQIRLVQNVSAEVTALLANPSALIQYHSDGLLFPYGPFTSTDDRYPGYGDYSAAQRGGQIPSHWLYGIMKGYNTNINTGLDDPRVAYYFYKQKTASAAPENCTDYRDGGFITMMFGSNGPCVGGSNSNTYTLMGIYPVGGKYDDNSGAAVPATSAATAGTGAAPQRALTYVDRLYLEAELINAGLAPGNEKTVFTKALDESFRQVDSIIINYVKPVQSVPVLATQPSTTLYKQGVITQYDNAGSPARRLEMIMTQKWISRLGNSVDNYTDYRRTKYPVMFNPAPANGGTTTSVIVPGGTGGIGAGTVQVSNGTEYPLSLLWSQTEINQNSNAPTQKIPSSSKVFWLP